jgi:GNAT superfamily N-acetyltransferase
LIQTLNFVPVRSEQDYVDQLELRNLEHWHSPLSLEEARSYDETFSKELRKERYLVRDADGAALMRCLVVEERPPGGGHFFTDATINPDSWTASLWRAGMEWCLSQAREWGAKVAVASVRDSRPEIVAEAEKLGFVEAMRNPVSILDLASFDPFRFPTAACEVISLAQLRDRVGEEWRRLLWRLDMDVSADVPMVVPFQEMSFEDYDRYISDPHFSLSTRFVALVAGEPAGMTELHVSAANPRNASTHLTGVRREFRRRGIARAMKVHAISAAEAMGVERISTDNEENNPMYQLNLELGFKRAWDWVNMRLEL